MFTFLLLFSLKQVEESWHITKGPNGANTFSLLPSEAVFFKITFHCLFYLWTHDRTC